MIYNNNYKSKKYGPRRWLSREEYQIRKPDDQSLIPRNHMKNQMAWNTSAIPAPWWWGGKRRQENCLKSTHRPASLGYAEKTRGLACFHSLESENWVLKGVLWPPHTLVNLCLQAWAHKINFKSQITIIYRKRTQRSRPPWINSAAAGSNLV